MVANEPRAYREVVCEVLGEMRPDVDFVIVEPEGLAEAASAMLPDLVICDKVIAEVCNNAIFWLELYPEQSSHSIVGTFRKRTRIENVQLSDIVSIVDQAVDQDGR